MEHCLIRVKFFDESELTPIGVEDASHICQKGGTMGGSFAKPQAMGSRRESTGRASGTRMLQGLRGGFNSDLQSLTSSHDAPLQPRDD
jgi:hypothetical protein